ncbi:Hypothetical protein ORPV_845 [Orpheovirus IHUMI-LCC2]|uniref:Uncharacterized protein n=1 Tax=Orpheovirus IHUMI-LCC2 TaxID=2023057 RepID=A0A2I2L5L7_9VIRU|nr:Hypothetical protein ORPV_845 [Orpheovirus IHUMI-LCC2]SNW62749.1 Hypothetical protein ORPV_845 [Orpheovirus IHUMI-LCC2]
MLGSIYLPKEIECNIVSNIIYADDIEKFIQDDDNNLQLAGYCIRTVVSGKDRKYNDVSPTLINKLPNVEEVDGIIQIETLEETYLVATHPSLHKSKFSLLFGDNTIFMIYQFILTLNKPLHTLRYLFYLSNDHKDYLYIHGDTLFIKYGKSKEVNILGNLLVHLLSLNIYENIYLFMNWNEINEENKENIVELLNNINKPINLLYSLDIDEIYINNNNNILHLLHNINIIPDMNKYIEFVFVFPMSTPSTNRIIIAPFHSRVIRSINAHIDNLQYLHTIGIRPYNVEINKLRDMIEGLPNTIKTVYVFTEDNTLLDTQPPISNDKDVIFISPQYMSFESSYIYENL